MRAERGFSLSKVVILLGIICTVFLVAIALVSRTIGIPRPHEGCRNNLKQIGAYFSLYSGKFHRLPQVGTGPDSWFGLVWRPDMAIDGNLFRCPSRKNAATGTDYWCIVRPGTWKGFSFATGDDLASPGAPGDLPVACDQLGKPGNHKDGSVSVLFLDGHVETFDRSSPFCTSPPPFLGPSGWTAPAGTK